VKIPEPGSPHDDGLTKDYTGNFPDQRQTVREDIIPTESQSQLSLPVPYLDRRCAREYQD